MYAIIEARYYEDILPSEIIISFKAKTKEEYEKYMAILNNDKQVENIDVILFDES